MKQLCAHVCECAHLCVCACSCLYVLRADRKGKGEVGLRPRCEEPINLAKEFKLYQDNVSTSQDFKQKNNKAYVEVMSLWPWELNCAEP